MTCQHNEWYRRIENPSNFCSNSEKSPPLRFSCRICLHEVSYVHSDDIPADFVVIGSIEDDAKRIIFLHSIKKGATQDEILLHLSSFCQDAEQIERINMNEQRFAFVQIKDPLCARKLIEASIDSNCFPFRISYANNQTPLLTKSLFLIVNRKQCGLAGMLPITPLLIFQIFYHFSNIRKIIVLNPPSAAPQTQTKVLIEMASCTDAAIALNFGQSLQIELEGHDTLEIQIGIGKNESIQNSNNSASSMIMSKEEEYGLRCEYPQWDRSLCFSEPAVS